MKERRSIEVPIHTPAVNYQLIIPGDGTVWNDGTDSPHAVGSAILQRAQQWVGSCGGKVVGYYITGNIIENASTMTVTYRSIPPRGASATATSALSGPIIGKQGGNLVRAPIRFRLPIPVTGVLVEGGQTAATGITTVVEIEFEVSE